MQLEEQLLTAKEVAEILKVSDRTIYNLTEKKLLRVIRVGGSFRYAMSDVKEYIKSARQDTDFNSDLQEAK